MDTLRDRIPDWVDTMTATGIFACWAGAIFLGFWHLLPWLLK